MDANELKQELLDLAAFMVTSARGLYDEPADYGIFRLIDSAGRLLAVMEAQGLGDPFITRLKQAIDEEREGSMDSTGQQERLDQIILEIVQEMQNR